MGLRSWADEVWAKENFIKPNVEKGRGRGESFNS
jgi:hypothetical protein